MNAVGVDVSKGKSMVAILRPMGEVVRKPYEISHDYGALETFAYSLKGLDGETKVIMEYTGRYYEPVARALHEIGVYVSVVNPILIHNFGKNSLRHVETDKKDALKIAKFGLDNWADLRVYTPMEAVRQQLKTASTSFTSRRRLVSRTTSSRCWIRPSPASTPSSIALSNRTVIRSGWTLLAIFGTRTAFAI